MRRAHPAAPAYRHLLRPVREANVLFFDRRAGSAKASTQRLWVYDLRTNKHFTLKTKPLQRSYLDEFVNLYKPGVIVQRQPTWSEANPEGRWRSYELEELLSRDKISLERTTTVNGTGF